MIGLLGTVNAKKFVMFRPWWRMEADADFTVNKIPETDEFLILLTVMKIDLSHSYQNFPEGLPPVYI